MSSHGKTPVTRHLLQDTLKYNYDNAPRLFEEIDKVVRSYNGLKPVISDFKYKNQDRKLVSVVGVVPTYIQGQTYNTPVHISIPFEYPQLPPAAFVVASEYLTFRQNVEYLDSRNGRCFLPYTENWNPSSRSLQGYIETLSTYFSSRPPLVDVRHLGTDTNSSPSPSTTQGISYQEQQQQQQREQEQREQQEIQRLKQELTEKVQIYLSGSYQKAEQDISAKQQILNRLQQKHQLIEESKQRLEPLEKKLQEAEQTLKEKKATLLSMEEAFSPEYYEDASNQSVDDILRGASPMEEQFLESVANISTYDDLVYALDKSLENQNVEYDEYLKQIRHLARDKFFNLLYTMKINNILRRQVQANHAPQPPPQRQRRHSYGHAHAHGHPPPQHHMYGGRGRGRAHPPPHHYGPSPHSHQRSPSPYGNNPFFNPNKQEDPSTNSKESEDYVLL